MLDRRTLMSATAGISTFFASVFTGRKASVATAATRLWDGDVEPRGTNGLLERLPALDLESTHDFLAGFRTMVDSDFDRAALDRSRVVLEEAGLNPYGNHPMETMVKLFENDPVIGSYTRSWLSSQQLTWKII